MNTLCIHNEEAASATDCYMTTLPTGEGGEKLENSRQRPRGPFLKKRSLAPTLRLQESSRKSNIGT
jgi:hypothetical protein